MVVNLQWASGALILILVYLLGPRTGLFHFHLLFPLGAWLLCDGLNLRLTGRSTLHGSKRELALLILLGALFGLLLDFQMVAVTRILRYSAVSTPLLALELYLGWGFCLPAIYESYRLAHLLTRGLGDFRREILPSRWHGRAHVVAGTTGAILIAVPLFAYLYMEVPGWLIVPDFLGLWLLLEYGIYKKGSEGLLQSLLEGSWSPLTAILIASVLLTLSWEGLNSLVGSWRYQNLFWLEPRLLGTPPVAFFGYFCWYVLFLSLHQLALGGTRSPEGPSW